MHAATASPAIAPRRVRRFGDAVASVIACSKQFRDHMRGGGWCSDREPRGVRIECQREREEGTTLDLACGKSGKRTEQFSLSRKAQCKATRRCASLLGPFEHRLP